MATAQRMTTAATLADYVGQYSMALARRLRAAHPGGVIICDHTLTAAQVRLQVNVLGRWFDFIHHDELLNRMERPGNRPFCLLTFDDGKRSNATEVAPELERLGVPAVFYVVTRFLTERRPLWFDLHDAVLSALGHAPPGLDLATLKRLPFVELEARLLQALEDHGITANLESDDVAPMSWDEARDLVRRGFTVGSHGDRHAILTNEIESVALGTIARSIAKVSQETGTACASFAFPNGGFTPRLARHAVACGVHTVMTTDPMWVDRRIPHWRLPRVQLFGTQGPARIELKIAVAATGQVLDNPDGTGRRYRREFAREQAAVSRGA